MRPSIAFAGVLLTFLYGCGRATSSSSSPATVSASSSQPAHAGTTTPSLSRIAEILAPREVDATIYQLGTDAESLAILETMNKSIQDHKEWFTAYLQEFGAKGNALPYHPNFGLTEDQYKRALNVKYTAMPMGHQTLTFVRNAQRELLFEAVDDLQPLNGLAFNPETGAFRSPLGNIEVPKPISGEGIFGPWAGFRWYAENGSALDLSSSQINSFVGGTLNLQIGELTSEPVGGLIYHLMRADKGQSVDIRIMITFPLAIHAATK